MAMHTLLERKDERGFFCVSYLSEPHAHGAPEGIYADVVYIRGDGPPEHPHGFNRLCASYREAANIIFREYGETPDYGKETA